MPLHNGTNTTQANGKKIANAGHAQNRVMGSPPLIMLDSNNTTGLCRIQFTNNFGFSEVREVPSHWFDIA